MYGPEAALARQQLYYYFNKVDPISNYGETTTAATPTLHHTAFVNPPHLCFDDLPDHI